MPSVEPQPELSIATLRVLQALDVRDDSWVELPIKEGEYCELLAEVEDQDQTEGSQSSKFV